jgi:hypothetical protein
MNHNEEFRDLVREAFQPPANAAQGRDLWPRMLRRIDQGQTRRPWLDWLLAAAALAWMIVFPEVIPSLLYHL